VDRFAIFVTKERKLHFCSADAFADEDLLLEFGSITSPQQAADVQARLEDRRAAAANATSSGSQISNGSGSSFVPRKLRKQQLPIEALPKVAIVGRPNVGKSAMFNRLAGSSLAVVYDYPGVTRDRLYTRAFWGDKEFCLIDTGDLKSDCSGGCNCRCSCWNRGWMFLPHQPHQHQRFTSLCLLRYQ